MPANEIMRLFRAGELHSGRSGRIVHKKSQARAILISYLRKEGHDIPEKKPDGK
jgi:hypothetical protein